MPDPAGQGDRSRDAAQVLAVRAGDATAFGGLFDRWFDRVYDVARNVLHDEHAAADVAQDTFLAAWQQLDRLADPASFGGWVLRIGRNRALDRLRTAQRTRPVEDEALNAVHDQATSSLGSAPAPADPVDVVAAVERDDLVHAAVLALGPRDASLVDLHLRHGLTPAEIAEELGVTPNAAHQQLFRMRERLGNAVGSLLLFRRGRLACPQLAAALGGASPTFDATTLGVIDRHGRGCAACTAARASMTAPQQLFASLPIAVVPVALRADVIARLGEHGVPTDPPALEAPAAPDSSPGPESVPTAPESLPADPAPGPGGTVRRGLRRRRGRRAAVVAGSTGLVAMVAVGLVLSRGDEPESRAAPVRSAAAATANDSSTSVDTTEPAATDSPATQPPATTDAPSTTVANVAPSPTSIEPRSGDKNEIDVTAVVTGRVIQPPTSAPSSTVPPATVPSATVPSATVPPATVPPAAVPPPPAPQATASPTTASPPAPTVPSTTTPSTTMPTTTVPPTAASTTTAAPAAPVVTGFTVAAGSNSLICAVPGQSPRRFQWTSMNATSASLTIGGSSRSVPLSGPYDACAGSGQSATIAVTGPGGDDSRSLVVP